jgi:hypothetical protein
VGEAVNKVKKEKGNGSHLNLALLLQQGYFTTHGFASAVMGWDQSLGDRPSLNSVLNLPRL